MSATAFHFMVYAPYQSDEGMSQRRNSVRGEHLKALTELKEKGVQKAGGPLMSPESIGLPEGERKMVGSLVIFEAKTFEEVRAIVENDTYYKNEVVSVMKWAALLLFS